MRKKIFYEAMPFYATSFLIHIIGLVLLGIAAVHDAHFWGIGLLAYTLGLRHAFDADHITAIDNTVRKLVQEKKSSAGVGFFFSLGHSTVVFLMALVVGLSVQFAKTNLPFLQETGGKIGAAVSGVFLIVIAIANCFVLFNLLSQLRNVKSGNFDQKKFDELLMSRGFLAKFLGPIFKFIKQAWQMYPVGFLFGLGFDTASEITLIALSAGTASQGASIWGILALPILFAAGMNVMDTTDSVMMSGAYRWAFDAPIRKIYYNLTVTTISIVAAFIIGIVELLQVSTSGFAMNTGFIGWVQSLDFNWVGYGLIVVFLVIWTMTYIVSKLVPKKENNANV